MLKEAIEKLLEISRPELAVVEGRTFCLAPGGAAEVRPSLDIAECVTLNSLDSLVKMVKTEALKLYPAPIYITVPSHLRADCFAQPDKDKREKRQRFYEVKATDVPGWDAATQMKFEEAVISIRTRFQSAPDSEYLLRLLSEVITGSCVTYNNDGLATSIVTRTGVSLQKNEPIRPIVTLKPYRTFQEVEQPASQFLIRVSERGISFTEADGGMWKLEARKTIKRYLDEAFAAEIEAGAVVVAL